MAKYYTVRGLMCEMSLGDIHLDLKTIVHYQKVQTLQGRNVVFSHQLFLQ